METYEVKTICENCGAQYAFDIPKGQTVKGFLSFQECPNCGCGELKMAPFSPRSIRS